MGIVEEVIDFSAGPSEGSLGMTVPRTPIGIALIRFKRTCLGGTLDEMDSFKNTDRSVVRPLVAKGETLLLGTRPTLLAVVISSSTDAACSVLCFSAGLWMLFLIHAESS